MITVNLNNRTCITKSIQQFYNNLWEMYKQTVLRKQSILCTFTDVKLKLRYLTILYKHTIHFSTISMGLILQCIHTKPVHWLTYIIYIVYLKEIAPHYTQKVVALNIVILQQVLQTCAQILHCHIYNTFIL